MYFSKEMQEASLKLTRKWEEEVKKALKTNPDQKERFSTVSDTEVKRLYTPADIKDINFARDIGVPGEFPYLRGNQVTGYRGRFWTFRMFSGMGSAQDTNHRWHMLLREGQTGLSTAFDFPTLMGYDSDSPKALGEVGKCGVAIDTLEDFLALMEGIPLDEVTTSMTINPPATILWAMYCAAADIRGVPLTKIGGTIQNDMLKEFIAQKTFMCPPEPSVKLISDTVEFGTKFVPRWNTISIIGKISPSLSKCVHLANTASGAPLVSSCRSPSGPSTATDIMRREKSNGISSTLVYFSTPSSRCSSLCCSTARSSTFFRPVWKWLMR